MCGRAGWAGAGLFRWGGVRWCGLVVCPGGGVWCRGVAVVGSAGGSGGGVWCPGCGGGCRWVCLCVSVPGWGVAGWVVPGVGDPGGEGSGRGADR